MKNSSPSEQFFFNHARPSQKFFSFIFIFSHLKVLVSFNSTNNSAFESILDHLKQWIILKIQFLVFFSKQFFLVLSFLAVFVQFFGEFCG